MSKKETKAKANAKVEETAKTVIQTNENGEPTIDVNDDLVIAQIEVNIKKLLAKREDAMKKFNGRLKRTPFEQIEDKGLTDAKNLYEEHLRIEKCESKLSASERHLVSQIALISMQEVFEAKIKEAREAGEIAAPIQKKKRTKKAK